ncbi:MAG: hypothetical protein JWR26_111 [Pedosphaera sp.]|nr:hypothetical protein [Pedosphaera sp.]
MFCWDYSLPFGDERVRNIKRQGLSHHHTNLEVVEPVLILTHYCYF